MVTVTEHGCHEWQGRRTAKGYGRRGHRLAHRVAYVEANGPIPGGWEIDHLCRNRGCVNPAHLDALPREVHAAVTHAVRPQLPPGPRGRAALPHGRPRARLHKAACPAGHLRAYPHPTCEAC